MLRSFNLLPPTVPTLEPIGTGLCHGPRHVLHRVVDAGGTSAAWICWSLWNEFSGPDKPFEIPVSCLNGDPLEDHACTLFKVARKASHESHGAGYLLFPDLSVLIVRQAEGCAWDEKPERDTLEVLPVVFRISPAINTRYGTLRPSVKQTANGATLKFAKPFNHDSFDAPIMIREHIDREVAAWAAWISRAPKIDRPYPVARAKTDWPAIFPRPVDWIARDIAPFEAHTLRAVQSVLAWDPTSFLQAQVSAWSSRPLQGGTEPMKIAINWNMHSDAKPYDKEALNEHVMSLIFGSQSEWLMDDFPCLEMHNHGPGSSYSTNLEMFTARIVAPPSSHVRLELTTNFAAPPAACIEYGREDCA